MNTLTQIKHPAMNVLHRMQTPDLLKSTIALVLDFDQITSWLSTNLNATQPVEHARK